MKLDVLINPYELNLILPFDPSIIEKESSSSEEKMKIGGVFLNRLKIKMKLQADPTIIYGLMPDFNGDITKKDLRIRVIYTTPM